MKTILIFTFFFSLNSFAKDGRFQLYSTDNSIAGAFMIDTHTGKLWRKQCITNKNDGTCAYFAWALEDVEEVNMKIKDIIELGKSIAAEENKKTK